jgi:hypothetical protein
LVPALDGALSLPQVHNNSLSITKNLHFNVMGLLNELLNKHLQFKAAHAAQITISCSFPVFCRANRHQMTIWALPASSSVATMTGMPNYLAGLAQLPWSCWIV